MKKLHGLKTYQILKCMRNLPELNIEYIYLYSQHFKMYLGSLSLTLFLSPVSLERIRDGRGRMYLLN